MTTATLITAARWSALPPAGLPVARLVLGQPAAEVAETLPRIFNLCRAAQSTAVRLALGLPTSSASDDLANEIRREHLLRLCLIWPQRFDLAPVPMQADDLHSHLFGKGLPDDVHQLTDFADSDAGLAPLLAAVMTRFAPQTAVANGLPVPTDQSLFSSSPLENSTAARQMAHPLMRDIERHYGRGPLWRVVGRALDLVALLRRGWRPEARVLPDGCVTVPAARGTYAVRATVRDGRVMEFARMTPTDHLLAKNGVMDQTLASLPPCDQDQAQAIIDVLDPCAPLTLKERPLDA